MSRPPVETQPERTGLAWQRTSLGVIGVAALIAHGAFLDGDRGLLLLAGTVALLGLVLLGVVAPVRYHRVRSAIAAGRSPSSAGLAGLTVGIVVLAALAAGVTVVAYA